MVDLEQDSAQGLSKLHGAAGRQVNRGVVCSPESEVTVCSWPATCLGDDSWQTDLDPLEVLDSGEWQHHGVAALAHFVRLFPEEIWWTTADW